jgi:anti-anti-sigma factor
MGRTPCTAELHTQAGIAIIDLHGEIDVFAEKLLSSIPALVAQQKSSAIILNFTDVEYINSTGIALIIEFLAQARAAQIRILVFGLSQHYQEIFQITRLADFMRILPDRDSALAEAVRPQVNE